MDAVTNEVPAAEMAPAVWAVAIVLYFPRRNVGPIAFAHLAGDPIAVLELRFGRRTVLLVAA